jgi:hypothetical protein
MESIMVSHSDELDEIVSTELSLDQLEAVSGGDQKSALLATTLSNLANMRREMLKTVANNLRA